MQIASRSASDDDMQAFEHGVLTCETFILVVQEQISAVLAYDDAKRVSDELNAVITRMCKFLGHGVHILMNEIIYNEC